MQVDVCEHCYSDNITNKKIIIFGPTPPPYGGVAVHIERVIAKLKKQNNTVIHYNSTVEYRYRFLWFYLLRLFCILQWHKPDIVYYHTPYLSNSLSELQLLAIRKKKLQFNYVVIDHNCRHMYTRSKQWKQKLQRALQLADQLICIGNKTYASYVKNLEIIESSLVCQAAFVPPDTTLEQNIFSKYSPEIKGFLQTDSPVILATSWRIPELKNDLYGFDICLEVITQLKSEFPDIGLLYIVSQELSLEQKGILQAELQKKNISTNVLIAYNAIELWPLFKKVDLFLRPTRSDGASVSVAESCYFGTSTIASDVCVRPKGVHLFKTGDAGDCIRVVRKIIQGPFDTFFSVKTSKNTQDERRRG